MAKGRTPTLFQSWRIRVAKPEWGMKRTCQSCGARFYDLNHKPIVCPKCGAVNESDLPFKARRGGAAATVAKAPVPVPVVAAVAEESTEMIEAEAPAELAETEEEEEELIEDASDLGEDEDDVAEVKDHMDNGVGR